MATIKELQENRGRLAENMKALVKKADEEKRSMSADEESQWNRMDADQEQIRKDIERREKIEQLERPATSAPASPALETRSNETSEERAEKENKSFRNWIRYGFDGLAPEERAIMGQRRSSAPSMGVPAEMRAQSTSTTAGGYLVPQGFSAQLEKALKEYGGMRSVARVFPTPDGRDIPWPTVDDTSNVGEIIAENSAHNAQDVAFGQVTLKAYKYSSKIVLVSQELLQDSFFNVEELLAGLLAERIGRITNTHFTTGDGSSKPKGIVAESSGTAGATGSATAVTYAQLVDLLHSVDPAYRLNARFMFADSTLKSIKKLVDGSSRPLWQPGLTSGMAAGAPDTILGYPYTINQDVAAMAANAKSVLFGDFSKYIIRDAKDVTIARLVERYAEYGQVGFLAFSRHEGRSINTASVKYFQNSAS